MTPLQRIEAQLSADDYLTHRASASADPRLEKLFIGLGRDAQQRDWILSLSFTSDVAAAFGVESDADEPVYFQIFLPLPFLVPGECLAEAARLILHLNRLLPAGAFGLSDPEGAAYFQITQIEESHELSPRKIGELVGLAAFFGRDFGAYIEALARGTKTRIEIITALESAGVTLHDIPPQPGAARH